RDQIENVKGVYVPGYAYYIDEYILMAREVYARRSRSVDKFLSRMPRAYMMAATKNERFVGSIATKHDKLKTILPQACGAIAQENNRAKRATMATVAEQFVESYRLDIDAGLRSQVDKALGSVFNAAAAYNKVPGAARFASLVWGAHVVGERIGRHLEMRAEQ